jgi:hypothetical protein
MQRWREIPPPPQVTIESIEKQLPYPVQPHTLPLPVLRLVSLPELMEEGRPGKVDLPPLGFAALPPHGSIMPFIRDNAVLAKCCDAFSNLPINMCLTGTVSGDADLRSAMTDIFERELCFPPMVACLQVSLPSYPLHLSRRPKS